MAKTKKKEEAKTCHRSYPTQHSINKEKLAKITSVRGAYRKQAAGIASLQWRYFFEAGIAPSRDRVEFPVTPLNARYQRNIEYQVVCMLQSWLSNRVNNFRDYVAKSSLDTELKRQLHTINLCHAWYYQPKEPTNPNIIAHLELTEARKEARRIKSGRESVPTKDPPYLGYPSEVFQLARWIMRAVMNRNSKPSYNKINMQLNANVAKLLPRQSGLPRKHLRDKKGNPRTCKGCYQCKPASKFDFWVKFSTLDAGNPIYLPLSDTKYHQKQPGNICESLQFNWNRFDELRIVVANEKPAFESLSLQDQEQLLEEKFGGP